MSDWATTIIILGSLTTISLISLEVFFLKLRNK